MSIEGSGPVSQWGALQSHAFDLARAVLVRVPAQRENVRDAAFRAYQRAFRALMQTDPARFTVTEVRPVATGEASRVVEVRMQTSAAVLPGDMLYLRWRNSEERAQQFAPGERQLRYFSTPLPHRPATRSVASERELLRNVIDLSVGETASLSGSERIVPRIYTVADVQPEGALSEIAIHVTIDESWPERAAAYLGRARAGEVVTGWVLPHPNRLDHAVPTLAIVTGSGAAGVFAALRDECAPIDLVWGLGEKELAPWIFEELAGHRAAGRLNGVTFARRPDRVTDLLDERITAPRAVYVSGNESMGAAVDALLRERWGDDIVDGLAADMTYIASW